MNIAQALTMQNLTPSGYFDLSETAESHHKDYIAWFQQQLTDSANISESLSQMILSPWLVDFNDYPRALWMNYLLNIYGFGFFSGTNTQAAYLYKLVSGGWSSSAIQNAQAIADAFCMAPFSWFESATVYSGTLEPRLTDTGFIVYSTSVTLPAAPATVSYTSRAWSAPVGWTQIPASATYYSRGYLSGSNILWCAPRPISDFTNIIVFSATVPGAVPSAGTVCIVYSDGTGDIGSIYYSDGSAWRKNSLSNVNLGLIAAGGIQPVPPAMTVWAPDPASVPYAISSSTPPPADGPTQGYGSFSGWTNASVTARTLEVVLTQIAGGNVAIATLLAVLRRIKPVAVNVVAMINDVAYVIIDARQV